jgi:hypothetical protein
MEDHDERVRALARGALICLPRIERAICGPLILRQLDHGQRVPQQIDQYGPEGSVKLCSSRALQWYMLATVVLIVASAVARETAATVAFAAALCLLGALSISRAVSAIKAGRRWRRAGGWAGCRQSGTTGGGSVSGV